MPARYSLDPGSGVTITSSKYAGYRASIEANVYAKSADYAATSATPFPFTIIIAEPDGSVYFQVRRNWRNPPIPLIKVGPGGFFYKLGFNHLSGNTTGFTDVLTMNFTICYIFHSPRWVTPRSLLNGVGLWMPKAIPSSVSSLRICCERFYKMALQISKIGLGGPCWCRNRYGVKDKLELL